MRSPSPAPQISHTGKANLGMGKEGQRQIPEGAARLKGASLTETSRKWLGVDFPIGKAFLGELPRREKVLAGDREDPTN